MKKIKITKGMKIKLLGDSITHGVGGTGFCQNGEHIVDEFSRNPDGFCWAKMFSEYMSEKYGVVVENNACTGTKIDFVINNFDTLVSPDDDIVICTIGTNNRHQYKTDGPRRDREDKGREFYNYVLELNSLLKESGKEYILIANIPASSENERDKEDFWRILHMDDINAIYKRASKKCGFNFISMYDLFSSYLEDNNVELDSLLCDGLHPNDDGYKVMFGLLTEALGVRDFVDKEKCVYKTETHLHTKESSPCAVIPAREMVRLYKDLGYSTVFVTDHFHRNTVGKYGNIPWSEKVKRFFLGYREARDEGEKIGISVLPGAEITFSDSPNDYLVYGITEEFCNSYPDFYHMGIKSFSEIAKQHSIFIVQAHPYRDGVCYPTPEYVDAVEVYNSNPRHSDMSERSEAIAREHNLYVTAGSDAHRISDVALSGVLTERKINTVNEYIDALVRGEFSIIYNAGEDRK